MKKLTIVVVAFICLIALFAILSSRTGNPSTSNRRSSSRSNEAPIAQSTPRVPAHFKDSKSAYPLKATLDPQQFFGRIRQAYEVAREIPETLAQLPCYCYCDQGFGHKSLHSCYEDDHSAHCATCVDEALMAYQLEKEQKLSPAEVRERIIARFSRQ